MLDERRTKASNSPRVNTEGRPQTPNNSRVWSLSARRRVNYSPEQRNEIRGRLNVSGMNPQEAANAKIAMEDRMRNGGNTLNYKGNASKRTLAYRRKGNKTGLGAAVNNRADALRARYGNDPRIARAAGSILANAYT